MLFTKFKEFPTTYSLIISFILFFVVYILLLFVFIIFKIPNTNQIFILLGAENTSLVLSGEVWRIITAAFLHANLIHLGFNVYAIYVVGRLTENFYGSKRTFNIFIITAIAGSLLSILFNIINFYSTKGDSMLYISVGASGGLFGLMGVLLGNQFRKKGVQLPINTTSLVYTLIFNLGISLFFPEINIFAHLGGAVAGLLIGLFLDTKMDNAYQEENHSKLNILFFILLGSVIISVILQIFNSLFL